MLDFGYYNMDCMDGMKEFPDKYFDLAVVDPPYGIGENGDKNKTRGKLAKAKDYKPFAGKDTAPPNKITLKNCSELARIRLFLERIILFQKFRSIVHAGLCGIRTMGKLILLTANWHGLLSRAPFGSINTLGAE